MEGRNVWELGWLGGNEGIRIDGGRNKGRFRDVTTSVSTDWLLADWFLAFVQSFLSFISLLSAKLLSVAVRPALIASSCLCISLFELT